MATKDDDKAVKTTASKAKAPAKAKAATPAKPRAKKVAATEAATSVDEVTPEERVEKTEFRTVNVADLPKVTIEKGKYIFAVGRRKTATATVRLFGGKGDNTANKQAVKAYFGFSQYLDKALKPLSLTGTASDLFFTAVVQGGGKGAQAEALRNAISKALVDANADFRPVLKKNGFLTRDDRKKERKKPGLKGARRRPQWAKR